MPDTNNTDTARSVLLIEGEAIADCPIENWHNLLTIAYSKIAPIDDGRHHVDIDDFRRCFDAGWEIAFPKINLFYSNDGSPVDVLVLIDTRHIADLPPKHRENTLEYCLSHDIATKN